MVHCFYAYTAVARHNAIFRIEGGHADEVADLERQSMISGVTID